jgi:hypothetical protein
MAAYLLSETGLEDNLVCFARGFLFKGWSKWGGTTGI